MKKAIFLALAAATSAETYFQETFDDSWEDRWVVSDWKKSDGAAGKFVLSAGEFYGDAEADKGLKTSQDARFYAASSKIETPFSNEGKDLVLQFSVKHAQKIDCGGGYIKIFPSSLDQAHASGDSDYNIMFGPDICGTTKKVHVIFNYKGENHLLKKEISCETDQHTHVYTLIVKPDNTYEVRIDGKEKQTGSLTDDWSFLPPKKIKDPDQSKPEDWVDEAKMDDPEDKKPEGYDDIPKEIVDPEAEKPEDWDDEDDGDWEAPMIDNPEYKGPWKAKKIDNPDYKGPWVHPEIDNPDFVDDAEIYKYTDNAFVGFDLWQVKSGTIFDNIIVTDDIAEAEALMAETYAKNIEGEKEMFQKVEDKKREEEEAARKAAEAEAEEEEDEDEEEEEEVKEKEEEEVKEKEEL